MYTLTLTFGDGSTLTHELYSFEEVTREIESTFQLENNLTGFSVNIEEPTEADHWDGDASYNE